MGYDPDRFDNVDDFWLCKICRQILQEPTLMCTLDHIVCRDCVSVTCPWPNCDGTVFDTGFRRDLTAARFIDTLVISCEECDWCGPVAQEAEHTAHCASRKVSCPNTKCTANVCFGNLATHLELCPEGLVPCPHNSACNKMSRRADILQHSLNCQFNPCRWQASGCTFRGPVAAIAAHEEYCTELHEELLRLRAVEKELKRQKKVKRHEERRVAREAVAQEQVQTDLAETEVEKGCKEENRKRREGRHAAHVAEVQAVDEASAKKARKEGRARRREERRAELAAKETEGVDATADVSKHTNTTSPGNVTIAVSPQINGHVSGSSAPGGTGTESFSLHADPATVSEPSSPASAETTKGYKSRNLYPRQSPANLMEGWCRSRGTTTPMQTKANGPNPDGIGSSCGSFTQGVEGIAAVQQNESTAAHGLSEAVNKSSSVMKRSRDDAGIVSAGPTQKKVRIRLPSPFLQPDTDEETSDASMGVDGEGQPKAEPPENLDSNGDADAGASDIASEELDDLVVTSVAGGTNQTEEGEVEKSIDITADAAPTPASLLARYHASKSVYMQPHFNTDSHSRIGFGHLDRLSQQYVDFPLPDLTHQYQLPGENEPSIGYDRASLSVSPVMRSTS